MGSHDRALRTTFDRVARLYDEVRPGYPPALIDDVVSLSGIPPRGSILEIGCGPGTATLPFARRGYTMLCLELGAHLARLAAARCLPYPHVRVEPVAFEAWPVQVHTFDLVICAEAFHWLSPELRFANTAAALKPGGALALFWNGHPVLPPPLFGALERVYARHAPQLMRQEATPPHELERLTIAEIGATGLFESVCIRRYPTHLAYTAGTYCKLLTTYSPVQALPEAVRRHVLQEVGATIERHGGSVDARYDTRLYVATVRRGPP